MHNKPHTEETKHKISLSETDNYKARAKVTN